MTGGAGLVTIVLLWIGYLHRTRRITWLGRLADRLGAIVDRPEWVALPLTMFLATILTALLGFIWDVSLHVGNGRDPEPLANPAHYLILVGLFFLFTAGMSAIVLPLDEKPGAAAVRITRTWYAPVGGILLAGGCPQRLGRSCSGEVLVVMLAAVTIWSTAAVNATVKLARSGSVPDTVSAASHIARRKVW